jgi:hypothetical protein
MTIPMESPDPGPGSSRQVDARPLWSGGVATAVVAALIAVVGILVARWLFNMSFLSPRREGAWGDASTAGYVFAAVGCALVATALMHLLLLTTPYPRVFFAWIIGLATLVAVIFPFSTTAPVSQKIATGFVNLVLGVAIGSLIAEVSRRATRRVIVRGDGPSRPGRPVYRSLVREIK